jgi:hypothetical protein
MLQGTRGTTTVPESSVVLDRFFAARLRDLNAGANNSPGIRIDKKELPVMKAMTVLPIAALATNRPVL